jgi:hypothetical protein
MPTGRLRKYRFKMEGAKAAMPTEHTIQGECILSIATRVIQEFIRGYTP